MDAIKILIAFSLLVIPFWMCGLMWWVYLWFGIALLLAIAELVSFLYMRKTISQQFWARWKELSLLKRTTIVVGMVLFWTYLILHLTMGV